MKLLSYHPAIEVPCDVDLLNRGIGQPLKHDVLCNGGLVVVRALQANIQLGLACKLPQAATSWLPK